MKDQKEKGRLDALCLCFPGIIKKIFLLTHDLCVISYVKFVFIRRIEK